MLAALFAQHLMARQTECDDVPLALMAFQGRLVAGVGKSLRLYDMGKKKLLRKVENKVSRAVDHALFTADLFIFPSLSLRQL